MSSGMKAWDDLLANLTSELGSTVIEKWLRPLRIQRFDACNLYLEAPDSFKAVWFEEHIRPRIQDSFFNNNNKKIRVHLSVRANSSEEETGVRKKLVDVPTPTFALHFDVLSPDATFDRFVVDSTANLLGYKLLKEAASTFPHPFNPIYLFGREGCGKTHLLMALTAELRAQGKKAIYVTGEQFTEHVVKAIRAGEMQTFRKLYRNTDALVVDDISILARKSATQEEFFHTFNTLHIEGKLLLISSPCSPTELEHIEPRLTSRFEWGIVVPLLPIRLDKLELVVEQKLAQLHLSVSKDVVAFLLKTFQKKMPSLLKGIEALALRSHLHHPGKHTQPITLDEARLFLKDLIAEEEKQQLTPAKIIRLVAEYYGIRVEDILSKSQARDCAVPRQLAMHLCRKELHLPFMKIGDLFSRDHSTVMASVKQVQTGLEERDPQVAAPMQDILQMLHAAT